MNNQFEEYKLLRETVIHFDKILISIRKIVIFLAFVIFGLTIDTIKNAGVSFKLNGIDIKGIDLSIALILVEILMVLCFFYLENHYRAYLILIANIAIEYEKKLDLGIDLKNNDIFFGLKLNKKKWGISQSLKYLHDSKMDFIERIAHYNIYTSLLSLGFTALSILLIIKNESINDSMSLITLLIMGIIIFTVFYIYGLRNIKKQEDEHTLHDNFMAYLIFIIALIIVTLNFSIIIGLIVGVFVFFVYSIYVERIIEIILELLVNFNIAPKNYLFSWNNVPGNDCKRLLKFLSNYFGIEWIENANTCKSYDNKTICISKDENLVKITIDEKKEKATLKINNTETYELKVKKEKIFKKYLVFLISTHQL